MYVLANCDLGRTEEIASELRKINQVQEVHMINGVFDIILKMSGPSTKDLEYVYFKIRHIHGIKSMSTLVGYLSIMGSPCLQVMLHLLYYNRFRE
ncbi:MAG: Lrp/AsnC family transcriptional regulator [Nitrososphaerales archaeon]